jgi:hypothetical protein
VNRLLELLIFLIGLATVCNYGGDKDHQHKGKTQEKILHQKTPNLRKRNSNNSGHGSLKKRSMQNVEVKKQPDFGKKIRGL